MYIDKPMRGHGVMQAITRVNCVFKDKPGGLVVVDYLGWSQELKQALATYTESGGTGRTTRDEALKLSEDEVAFYDVLETNDSAVKILGDETCAPSLRN